MVFPLNAGFSVSEEKIEENPDIVSIGNPGARRGGWLNGAEIIAGKRRQSLQDFAELADVVDCYLVVVSEVCSVHKKLPLCNNYNSKQKMHLINVNFYFENWLH